MAGLMDLYRVPSEQNIRLAVLDKGQVGDEVRGDARWQRPPAEARLGLRVDPRGIRCGFQIVDGF